ncbi:hypothetical protein RB195_015289 [Necator americanus]|uniref:Uncharacterized protein n=1 Tax=Necator americanus TaxID=51031 RepID=A0ABR1E4D9_NECAM
MLRFKDSRTWAKQSSHSKFRTKMLTLNICGLLIVTISSMLIINCSKIFISKTGSKPGDSKASRKSGSSNTVTSRSSASQVDVSHKLKKDGEKKTKIVEFVIRKKKSNEEIKTDLKSITDEEDPFKKRYREKQEEQLKGKVEQYFSNVGEKEKDLSVYGMDRTQLKKDTEKTQGMTRTTATQALK